MVALLLLVAVGCGTTDGAGLDEVSPPSHASASPATSAAQRWNKARQMLLAAGSGRYHSRSMLDVSEEPFVDEQTAFDLSTESIEMHKDLLDSGSGSGSGKHYVVTARLTSDGTSYMQMADWGSWDGCWLPVDPAAVADQTGSQFGDGPNVPAVATVVLDADHPAPVEQGALQAMAPALAVLQTLEVSARPLLPVSDDLEDVTVPVTMTTTTEGLPQTIEVDGSAVADEIADSGVKLGQELTQFLQHVDVVVDFEGLGEPVRIERPRRDELLDEDAGKDDTCPANR
jgi:hypothetical protein